MSNDTNHTEPNALHLQPCEPDDASLRVALLSLVDTDDWTGTRQWEAIGAQILTLAERDSRAWPDNVEEYRSAYVLAAITLLRRRLSKVQAADEPVAMLVEEARFSGQNAALAERRGGLTGRDPSAHRTCLSRVPGVCSLDRLNEHLSTVNRTPVLGRTEQ